MSDVGSFMMLTALSGVAMLLGCHIALSSSCAGPQRCCVHVATVGMLSQILQGPATVLHVSRIASHNSV